jgi:hypothetical protein
LRGYRDIIVKLKEEFVKSEEEKAIAMLKIQGKSSNAGGTNTGQVSVNVDDMRELRSQVGDQFLSLLVDIETYSLGCRIKGWITGSEGRFRESSNCKRKTSPSSTSGSRRGSFSSIKT